MKRTQWAVETLCLLMYLRPGMLKLLYSTGNYGKTCTACRQHKEVLNTIHYVYHL